MFNFMGLGLTEVVKERSSADKLTVCICANPARNLQCLLRHFHAVLYIIIRNTCRSEQFNVRRMYLVIHGCLLHLIPKYARVSAMVFSMSCCIWLNLAFTSSWICWIYS